VLARAMRAFFEVLDQQTLADLVRTPAKLIKIWDDVSATR